jgi:hypothetical protein
MVFGIMSMGLFSFGMCDDDGGIDCDDSNCDVDCDTDGDGDCDYHHEANSDERFWDSLEEARQQQYKYEAEFGYLYSDDNKVAVVETSND